MVNRNKKIKNIVLLIIVLISLLELYFSYKVAKEYAGIYEIGIFLPFIIQPFIYYKLLFKVQKTYFKSRFTVVLLISFTLPLTIFFTLPNFTYNEGKQLIEEYAHSDGHLVFRDISKDEDTKAICNNPSRLFVSDRAYYYEIQLNGKNEFFLVNPLTGRVEQLLDKY
ncbi:hypothetical protein [Clostridium grantii]|uniref:Uncharacterized protein n=1 Tax=Clostridium grantii DSM 8605 TaxID=1121316 RepID=A0A1M5VMU3_9CLOT|nr:hypothetical protein [Clostridium grantii]SHH76547.1 hypothetical protein SAMN02745207_02369 [Clostridium grantii DSM 8605]